MAWYEIHTSKAIFNKQFAAPPRVGEQLWLHTGDISARTSLSELYTPSSMSMTSGRVHGYSWRSSRMPKGPKGEKRPADVNVALS